MSKQQSKTGFTIIEVVLVLAIAGLIFLMVFLALPALQRSQRDTQRRDDMSRFASQISQYQSNNRGKVPTSATVTTYGPNTSKADIASAKQALGNNVQIAQTGEWTTFLDNYMWAANDDFTDPGGVPYLVTDKGTVTTDGTSPNVDKVDYQIYVYHGAICGTTEGTVDKSTSGGSRKLAFLYKLEGTGYYCGEV